MSSPKETEKRCEFLYRQAVEHLDDFCVIGFEIGTGLPISAVGITDRAGLKKLIYHMRMVANGLEGSLMDEVD